MKELLEAIRAGFANLEAKISSYFASAKDHAELEAVNEKLAGDASVAAQRADELSAQLSDIRKELEAALLDNADLTATAAKAVEERDAAVKALQEIESNPKSAASRIAARIVEGQGCAALPAVEAAAAPADEIKSLRGLAKVTAAFKRQNSRQN